MKDKIHASLGIGQGAQQGPIHFPIPFSALSYSISSITS
uniref:Uncharacterized protein n=1 Tax=Anguilla anguilla TaxID=7936 RepID=A0A0E9V2J5_ANGAN